MIEKANAVSSCSREMEIRGLRSKLMKNLGFDNEWEEKQDKEPMNRRKRST
jgi:hypothetical protein